MCNFTVRPPSSLKKLLLLRSQVLQAECQDFSASFDKFRSDFSGESWERSVEEAVAFCAKNGTLTRILSHQESNRAFQSAGIPLPEIDDDNDDVPAEDKSCPVQFQLVWAKSKDMYWPAQVILGIRNRCCTSLV